MICVPQCYLAVGRGRKEEVATVREKANLGYRFGVVLERVDKFLWMVILDIATVAGEFYVKICKLLALLQTIF